jgi:hypothetical protein
VLQIGGDRGAIIGIKQFFGFRFPMQHIASLVLPAVIGLLAGLGHGFIAHQAHLPMALGDQVAQLGHSSTATPE